MDATAEQHRQVGDLAKIRIAVAQFAVGADVDENLGVCLRNLDRAAQERPDLVVLPEFCNHASWYEDQAHCHGVSVSLDGPFLQSIAEKARDMGAYVVINVTLQRGDAQCTGTSLLYGRDGTLLASSDKQVPIGHENDFLRRAVEAAPITATPFGRIGLYACMDGVIMETPRCLALRGAQLLCNSLNSFASDEASLHIPVRAAENKVFVAAANKVGPLIPADVLAPVSRMTGIPVQFLMGAGESQITAPDGRVLAKASPRQEEVVYADICLAEADSKQRPDGSDIFAWRRPTLYAPLAERPKGQQQPAGVERVHCALIQLSTTGAGAEKETSRLLSAAFAQGVRLAALPPLSFLHKQRVDDLDAASQASSRHMERLAELCGENQFVATTAVAEGPRQLCAVLVGKAGLVLRQGQLHSSERYAWSALSGQIETLDLGFLRAALLTSDDACIPEAFRLAALAGADTLIVPALPLEAWEMQTGLLERSAENRVNLLVAAQPSPFGASFATQLQRDFTLREVWRERTFDGVLSQPPVVRATPEPGVTHVQIHPRWAANKVVSPGTDLLAGRPWRLLEPICRAGAGAA